MPSLKEVKIRINSIISTQQITKAMKMVAASKLRKAQDKILQMRPFSQKISDLLNNTIQALEGTYESEFAVEREIKRILIIPITSDRGLCGAFNSNIFRKVRDLIEGEYSDYYRNNNLLIMPLGKKSYDFYRKRNFMIIDQFWGIFFQLNFKKVQAAADYVLNGYKKREFDKVIIIYNEFKNVATQILKSDQFLPIKIETGNTSRKRKSNYIFEPAIFNVVGQLIPKSLSIQFFKNILESNASENGARMTAMDQATENASDLLSNLRLTYNRTRQSAITKEINEIVGGANAQQQ
jgi:F-type H+-transporting ATPase subunit gamma